jgi:malonyl-CoA O-methyltransferase
MLIDKKLIRARFESASSSYDNYAIIQQQSAEILVRCLRDFIPNFRPKTVLDVGCGTGYASGALRKYYSGASYTLTDIALNMLRVARKKFSIDKSCSFYVADMERCAGTNHDLIISNLAVQWAHNLEVTLAELHKKSKVLAFSCLLDGTFSEWTKLLNSYGLPDTTKKYPTQAELETFLLSLGGARRSFHTADLHFECANAHAFMHHLQRTGASTSSAALPYKRLAELVKYGSQRCVVTYKIFFGVIEQI